MEIKVQLMAALGLLVVNSHVLAEKAEPSDYKFNDYVEQPIAALAQGQYQKLSCPRNR